MRQPNFEQLENNLGLKFKNPKLLRTALTHRSYLNETSQQGIESNERLEFLGDAILSFIISQWLFREFPLYPEGNLTNIRANLVRTTALAKVSQKLRVGNFLLMSKGEEESEGAKNVSLLANAFEAIVGAIFLDQRLEVVETFVHRHFSEVLKTILENGNFKDAKSLLQEKTQAETNQSPLYKTLKEIGPDHDKTFTVGVFLGKQLLATGTGKTKQQAEEEAAKLALK